MITEGTLLRGGAAILVKLSCDDSSDLFIHTPIGCRLCEGQNAVYVQIPNWNNCVRGGETVALDKLPQTIACVAKYCVFFKLYFLL